MHILSFMLSPEGVVRVHDAVLCLAKFSEMVSLEARSDKLVISALNSSQSAYASFTLHSFTFFESYHLDVEQVRSQQSRVEVDARFTCQLYNKALLYVFKGQLRDLYEKDTAIERCECYIQEQPDRAECRLIVKMVCRHGVIKTYKLTYESVEIMHALFNKHSAKNTWCISAKTLRSFAEYFGAGTEQLDISNEGGRATFTCYTEKVMNGKDVLKQPLRTSVTIDNLDFDSFEVEEGLHVGITVKDFKAITLHAESLKASITALFSYPTRPMQLTYSENGMQCDFTLMTIGEYHGPSATPTPAPSRQPSVVPAKQQPSSRPPSAVPSVERRPGSMLPPSQPTTRPPIQQPPASQRVQRPSPPPPKPSLDPDSLFVHQYDDEDRPWGERNYEEEEDTVGWSATVARGFQGVLEEQKGASKLEPYVPWQGEVKGQIQPTQRMTQIENQFGL